MNVYLCINHQAFWGVITAPPLPVNVIRTSAVDTRAIADTEQTIKAAFRRDKSVARVLERAPFFERFKDRAAALAPLFRYAGVILIVAAAAAAAAAACLSVGCVPPPHCFLPPLPHLPPRTTH
jgi:hypothetical protein